MNPIIRNVLAVIAGIFVCMFVNGGITSLGQTIIPLPEGMNPNDLESWKAFANLMQPKHFVMPFLAHALGSLFGGLVAAFVAASRKMTFALVIGCVHLLGGIAAAFLIPAPVWFIVLDLIVAYIPSALLGGKLGSGKSS